jgi:hypothetical protein
MSSTAVLSCNGFHADGLTLKKVLEQRMKVKRHTMDFDSARQMAETYALDRCTDTLMTRK